eukprot:scaffold3561_cov101-Isochrysis_galbana.AAC.2
MGGATRHHLIDDQHSRLTSQCRPDCGLRLAAETKSAELAKGAVHQDRPQRAPRYRRPAWLPSRPQDLLQQPEGAYRAVEREVVRRGRLGGSAGVEHHGLAGRVDHGRAG